ncbi:PREDICTED: protein YLS3-like isoform X2 [Ipomoea nil]|uniref:protein YLS3-like isoform X2 n=1 Tax=Ipomoea nil TaxID=35883 RepID=UPI000901F8E0|nr:PREDICTED: protein YLS3-like isoform X2 [Ipomoea nil]
MEIKGMKSGLILGLAMVAMIRAAAAQSGGCTTAILSMASCLDYVTGKAPSPSSGCCTAFSGVLKSQPRCLCTIVNGGGSSVGVQINQTLALQLPDSCKLKTPPVSKCNEAGDGPAISPVGSPEDSPAVGASNSAGNINKQPFFPVSLVFSLFILSTLASF